ncbi:MAG: sulfite exporter TauE/SafE family protein [Firmicutes bacterium]|nr:sulfite exporter TauE/SafE family protein [Bacillota bacterium]
MPNETLYISTVFAAGVLSFLSPCIVPLLPVYLSTLASPAAAEDPARRRLQLFLRTLLFIAGISVTFVILGFGAGALGQVLNSRVFMIVLGALVVLLGIHQTGLLRFKFLEREKRVGFHTQARMSAWQVFALGFLFSFGWTPCIGPVLAAILGLAAGGGAAFYGAFLMGVYSLGFAVPFLILALFSELLIAKLKRLNRYLPTLKIVGGVLIIVMGILLMTDSLNVLSAWIGG